MSEQSARRRRGRRDRAVEWPTVAVAALVYGGWLLVTYHHAAIPIPLRFVAGGLILAWHGSLQHETIHGHPTRWPAVNRLIGAAPLSLWLPYEHYRHSHLAHHETGHLTDPAHDPESRYRRPGADGAARLGIAARTATATLGGRLLLGPVVEVGGFLCGQAVLLARSPRRALAVWLPHLPLVAGVLAWLLIVCRLSMAEYVAVFVYPGAALSLLRSFAEHRASADPRRRIATVERAPVLGLLFLNNNLHFAHHRAPALPWYRLPERHRRTRPHVLASGAPVYAGYREVVARYLFRPHDRVVHPTSVGEGVR